MRICRCTLLQTLGAKHGTLGNSAQCRSCVSYQTPGAWIVQSAGGGTGVHFQGPNLPRHTLCPCPVQSAGAFVAREREVSALQVRTMTSVLLKRPAQNGTTVWEDLIRVPSTTFGSDHHYPLCMSFVSPSLLWSQELGLCTSSQSC